MSCISWHRDAQWQVDPGRQATFGRSRRTHRAEQRLRDCWHTLRAGIRSHKVVHLRRNTRTHHTKRSGCCRWRTAVCGQRAARHLPRQFRLSSRRSYKLPQKSRGSALGPNVVVGALNSAFPATPTIVLESSPKYGSLPG